MNLSILDIPILFPRISLLVTLKFLKVRLRFGEHLGAPIL